jgi:hypothetical protein
VAWCVQWITSWGGAQAAVVLPLCHDGDKGNRLQHNLHAGDCTTGQHNLHNLRGPAPPVLQQPTPGG